VCVCFTKTSRASLLWKTASACSSESFTIKLSPSLSYATDESAAVSRQARAALALPVPVVPKNLTSGGHQSSQPTVMAPYLVMPAAAGGRRIAIFPFVRVGRTRTQ
jgi:hypothetical protein